ncbi:hypothetical protein RFI_24753 [Reticulomyxa filosa]|uniref:Uncharacterized protein n=1 Tax=Reticulomyxa filosa TaxID=46433 RepID=X6MFE7_RETFI|nr:hypothetical protein RFI_24753 [Reticulomyxa filosa]|eukprot:ETO12624.1 hypothetical protein RFI_24753 [Reticulomyxa filosa]
MSETENSLSIENVNITFPVNFKEALLAQAAHSARDVAIDSLKLWAHYKNNSVFHMCLFPSLDRKICPMTTTIVDLSVANWNVSGLDGEHQITLSFAKEGLVESSVAATVSQSHPTNCYQCAWYDRLSSMWRYDGCHTYTSSDGQSYECSCNLLTYFTIANAQCKSWYWSQSQIIAGICLSIFICTLFAMLGLAWWHYGLQWSWVRIRIRIHRSLYIYMYIYVYIYVYVPFFFFLLKFDVSFFVTVVVGMKN